MDFNGVLSLQEETDRELINHLVWTSTHLLVRPEVDSSERTREDYHLLDMWKLCTLLLIVLTESLEPEITTPLERTCSYSKFDSCARRLPTKDKYVEVTSKFPVNFLCDTKTDGGGWIVFQRRFYRDTDFNRSFVEYEKGFGTICSDFWLGNSLLYTLTSQDKYELRVDMVFEGQRFYAQYDNFKVSSEKTHYTLTPETSAATSLIRWPIITIPYSPPLTDTRTTPP
ncbi:hypothetical protein Btru_046358 [Bulinus truncatus]|nr:hypothetical protein Btru_046358 [Bulinus truncatus]